MVGMGGVEVEQGHGQVSLGKFWPFLTCSQPAALQGESQILLRNGTPMTRAGSCRCSALPATLPQRRAWSCRKIFTGLRRPKQLMLGGSCGLGRGAVLAGGRGLAPVEIPSLGIFKTSNV